MQEHPHPITMNKKVIATTCIFSGIFIIIHFIAALLLCRERLYLDTAYYFFRVVSADAFRVEHQRIILVLSQVLLLAGVKLHLSFLSLIELYSVTPIIYTAVLLFISLYYFRSAGAAWMLICCNVCGTYFLYYSPMYEVCYAIVTFGFLWLLTVRGFYHTPLQMLVYIGLLALCLLGYPVIAMGCAALFIYMMVYERKFPRRLFICYAIVFSGWLLLKIFWISDYEKANVTVTTDKTKIHSVVSQVFSLAYIARMLLLAVQHYFIAFAAALIASAYSFRQKKYAQALYPVISLAFIIIFMNLKSGGEGLVSSIHNERSYLIMVPMCLAPLFYYVFERATYRLVLFCIFILISDTIYESIHTWRHSSFYALRLQEMDNFADSAKQKNCTKITSPVASLPAEINDWSTGIEIMIRSTSTGRSIAWVDKEVYDSVNAHSTIGNGRVILSMNIDPLSPAALNPRYFNCDSSAYCIGK